MLISCLQLYGWRLCGDTDWLQKRLEFGAKSPFEKLHALVMGFIAAETIVGLTCPMTFLEYHLRGDSLSRSFVGYWIERILYWDLPMKYLSVVCFVFCMGDITMEVVPARCKTQMKHKRGFE